jgi:hypothetical protein
MDCTINCVKLCVIRVEFVKLFVQVQAPVHSCHTLWEESGELPRPGGDGMHCTVLTSGVLANGVLAKWVRVKGDIANMGYSELSLRRYPSRTGFIRIEWSWPILSLTILQLRHCRLN